MLEYCVTVKMMLKKVLAWDKMYEKIGYDMTYKVNIFIRKLYKHDEGAGKA